MAAIRSGARSPKVRLPDCGFGCFFVVDFLTVFVSGIALHSFEFPDVRHPLRPGQGMTIKQLEEQ
jgi:hypothetical protein